MYMARLGSFLSSALIFLSCDLLVYSHSTSNKNAKEFSLFSVVTFQNKECTSDTSIVGGTTEGTCYSSTECTDKGGTKSGNCASGFGVCCVFLNTLSATSTVTENRTRIRNTEFTSYQTSTDAKAIVYTINKMSSDICQIRLDFTQFIIGGPANTVESIATTQGHHCVDTFRITTTENPTWSQTHSSTLCGALTGEHIYIELSPDSTDTATLTLNTAISTTMTPAVAQRLWDIKTSQIECFATYRAPNGCDRYIMETQGKITSYNFYRVSGTVPLAGGPPVPNQNTGLELALQRVNTCIRRAKGMCCVEYQVCATFNSEAMVDTNNYDAANDDGSSGTWNSAWSIDLNTTPFVAEDTAVNQGLTDDQCTGDYVEIPSSWSGACGAGSSGSRAVINSRYCGSKFGANPADAIQTFASTPVCDCSEPFVVRHGTDDLDDVGGMVDGLTGNPNTLIGNYPRGFCLDYRQTPCWQ